MKTVVKRFFLSIVYFICFGSYLFAANSEISISPSTSTSSGSYGGVIQIFSGTLTASGAYAVNVGSDNMRIGDMLRGYYYDSAFGFFRFDFFSDANKVQIIDTVTPGASIQCPDNSLAYKIGGYTYSEASGLVNLAHSNYVYTIYCPNLGKMYGYGYGESVGYQKFDGISLEFPGTTLIAVEKPKTTDTGSGFPEILNLGTALTDPIGEDDGGFSDTLQGEIIGFDAGAEDIFYLVK